MSLVQNNNKQEKLSLLPEYSPKNPDTHEKIICDFIIKETLGKGAFGVVKLAINSQTGEKVAIKIINESKIPKEQKLHFQREIDILKNIKHPNIIRLLSYINKERQLYLITEYIKGIELYQYISLKKKVEESEACFYFQQIICGLEYLHKMGISHRDIKAENILVDHYLKEIKIIDFGLSNKYSDNSELLSTLCGSPLYAAPEVLIGKGYKPRPVDIWSAGILLYFMLSGKLPFHADSDEELYKKIIDAKISDIKGISKEGNDLIKQILNPNPRKRLSIAKIKKHPWFNLFNNNNFVNINYYGLFINKYVIPVDEEIVEEIKNKFNISDIEIRRDILENKLNDTTTLYYLFVFKKNKEGIKSISDFKNEIFRNYLKDENNLLKNYGNDIKKVIRMRKKGIEYENEMKLKRVDSKGNKEIPVLVKVNSEEKNEFFKVLSPNMKKSKIHKYYTKNNSRIQSPKSKNSVEKSEISKSNYKNINNDTEIENKKNHSIGKYKRLLIKENTDKSNFDKKNNNKINSNQKKIDNNNIQNTSNNKNNKSENKIENKIITSRFKTSNKKANLTYTNVSPNRKNIEEEIVNKNKKSEKKDNNIDNNSQDRKNEKKDINNNDKDKKNEIKEINIYSNKDKKNEKKEINIDNKDNKDKKSEKKEINTNNINNKNKRNDNNEKIIKNNNNKDTSGNNSKKTDKEKEKDKHTHSPDKKNLHLNNLIKNKNNKNFRSVRISPKKVMPPLPLESIKENKENKKIEIIKKIKDIKLNINSEQKSNTLREHYSTNYKNDNRNYTPKREENIMNFKKQNTGLLYKKRKDSKNKNICFNKNNIRKKRMDEMKKSNINNTNYKSNRNKCLNLHSVENSKIKNKDNSIKKYLYTEKNNNEEELVNQKEIQRYFSTDILDTKKSKKKKKDNILTENNSITKKDNHYVFSKSNTNINSPNNKLKTNLFFSLSNNLNININTDINLKINDLKDNNLLNEFIEPFDLNSIYLNKKGLLKKELLENLEKKKIKHKKIGNYIFVIELKKDTSIELDIKGNKDLLYDNICILKIKKIKGNHNNIFNCLKKII